MIRILFLFLSLSFIHNCIAAPETPLPKITAPQGIHILEKKSSEIAGRVKLSFTVQNTFSTKQTISIQFTKPPAPYIDKDGQVYLPVWSQAFMAYRLLDKFKDPDITAAYHGHFASTIQKQPLCDYSISHDENATTFNHTTTLSLIHKRYSSSTLKRLLNANNIPLSAAYLQPLKQTNKLSGDRRLRRKCKDLGLLDDQERLTWQTQETYNHHLSIGAKRTAKIVIYFTPLDHKNELKNWK